MSTSACWEDIYKELIVVDTQVKLCVKSYKVHTLAIVEQSYWVIVLRVCFQDFAIQVIKSTHNHWKDLISQKAKAGELNWWDSAPNLSKLHLMWEI